MLSSNCEHEDFVALDASDVNQPSRSVKKTTLIALMMGSVGFVGFLGGQQYSSPTSAAGADDAHRFVEMLQGELNATQLSVSAYTPSCYGFTGGTCATHRCNAEREATCSMALCVCEEGCTGVDGTCRPSLGGSAMYPEVSNGGFNLTNVYWSDYVLYMPKATIFSPLKTSNMWASTFFNQEKFFLYELPGRVDGKKFYFLASAKEGWETWVAAMGKTPPYLAYSYNLATTVAPWDPQGVVVNVCSIHTAGVPEGAVRIGSKHDNFFYVQRLSWKVAGSLVATDPGKEGYWVPSVPLEGVEPCEHL